ncbi:MAG TPA: alpha-L-arabinofuranosidase C-terminal domain-containing protein, partial [Bryobacteraceae bacterium]|nr:alpha-L-arabinofuranosidase C-terminal domain-containing protein [Bryobacteraceae bacterium]
AQLVNVIAPIFTNEKGLFLQPIYFPLAEYAKQKNNTSVDLLVNSPTYKTGNRKPLGYLDASATWDQKAGMLYVNVLNRSKGTDIKTRIDNVTGTIDGAALVWEMNHPDLKATHTFGDDKKVRPAVRQATLARAGTGFEYTFSAHSLTILKLKVLRTGP